MYGAAFVPHFREKGQTIGGKQRCIRKSARKRNRSGSGLESGMAVLVHFTYWSTRGAAVTTDSTKRQGYGSRPQDEFSGYQRRDGVRALLAVCARGSLHVCCGRNGRRCSCPVFSGRRARRNGRFLQDNTAKFHGLNRRRILRSRI